MHLLSEQTATIACAAETAYRYAADLEHFGHWFPGVISIVAVNALDPAQPGKEYLETVATPLGGRRSVRVRVQEAERGRWLATEGSLRPLMPRMEMRFEPQGDAACRLTWRMLSRNDGLLVRWLLLPLARRVVAARAAVGVARLKALLESPGGSGPA